MRTVAIIYSRGLDSRPNVGDTSPPRARRRTNEQVTFERRVQARTPSFLFFSIHIRIPQFQAQVWGTEEERPDGYQECSE